jgi:hypothetical protein
MENEMLNAKLKMKCKIQHATCTMEHESSPPRGVPFENARKPARGGERKKGGVNIIL